MADRAAGDDLTFFYIVEPPDYQIYACTLLASIRSFFPAGVRAIGYCPAHRMADLHPAVLKAHAMMGAEVRPMQTEGRWDTPYPHGNKILAALEPRDTAYSAFVDSDVLFQHPNDTANLIRAGHVTCSVAASMKWAEQSIWDVIYGAFDMAVPTERVRLMRQNRKPMIPYFSSGFVIFPEGPGPQGRFADVWYDTARHLDRVETLENRRPYLDQMTLPLAIRRAGLEWNPLPEEQHYILGGRLKGKPLPEGRTIYTLHYRHPGNLRDVGRFNEAKAILKRQVGVPFVRQLVPDHAGGDPSPPPPAAQELD